MKTKKANEDPWAVLVVRFDPAPFGHTDETEQSLRAAGVPDEVLRKLDALKNRETFEWDLDGVLTRKEAELFKDRILNRIARDQCMYAIAEFLGAANELEFVRDELQNALCREDLATAFGYVHYQLENYFYRLYAMMERASIILAIKAGLTGGKRARKTGGKIRKQQTRGEEAQEFLRRCPEPTKVLLKLLKLTDFEMLTRETHTHESFFELILTDGNSSWSIDSALLATAQEKELPGTAKLRLRLLLKRLVAAYTDQIDRVVRLARSFVGKVRALKGKPP